MAKFLIFFSTGLLSVHRFIHRAESTGLIIFMNSILILSYLFSQLSVYKITFVVNRNNAGLKWVTHFSVAFISLDGEPVGPLSQIKGL